MPDPAIFAWFPSGEVRRISPPVGYYAHPCIHPDGTHAVFWGGALGTPGIWRADLESGKVFRLTSMASGSWHPGYGLSGTEIVFVSDRFGNQRSVDMDEVRETPGRLGLAGEVQAHVFTMRLDGRGVRQVTTGEWYDQRPAINPDSTRIAFVSNRDGRPGIWLVAAEEHAEPASVASDVAAESVAWSVDGETIYFSHRVRDAFAVGAVPADGGEWRPVGAGAAAELRDPFPDPGGEALVVQARGAGGWSLAELMFAGETLRPLAPAGFTTCGHGSRARNGVVVFESLVPSGAGR